MKFSCLLILSFLVARVSLAQTRNSSLGKVQFKTWVEFGIDSSERKYYQPLFHFSWPLSFLKNSRFSTNLSYLQRANSRLQGTVDFWLRLGLENELGENFKFETSLNHFCRHLTSQNNAYILNLNEVLGRFWWIQEKWRIGWGFGYYLGGSKGYDNLLVINLGSSQFFFPEISFLSEWKWINFSEILYDLEISFALDKGAALFLRKSKTYQMESITYLGFRLKSEGTFEYFMDSSKLCIGFYPFYDLHKLIVQGEYRLGFFKSEKNRLFFNINFNSPILSGDSFFAQFWPDSMVYSLRGEYEKKISNRLFLTLYGRYLVDLPADKDLEFRSNLGTGIGIRNQTDFERLEKIIRFEASAGCNFKLDYDLSLKLGMNTLKNSFKLGFDFFYEVNEERHFFFFRLFTDFGREISVRPFFGVRKISYADKERAPAGPSETKLVGGLSFYKWF